VSTELGTDAGRRARWRNILDHLSDFPTAVVDGVRRVRGAEAGPAAGRVGPNREASRVEFMGMVWPSSGAFLVTSELRDGEVKSLLIESEKGRECILQNPWPGQQLVLKRDDRTAETLTGDCVRFMTSAGERIAIGPASLGR
jgi:hypothetical protein